MAEGFAQLIFKGRQFNRRKQNSTMCKKDFQGIGSFTLTAVASCRWRLRRLLFMGTVAFKYLKLFKAALPRAEPAWWRSRKNISACIIFMLINNPVSSRATQTTVLWGFAGHESNTFQGGQDHTWKHGSWTRSGRLSGSTENSWEVIIPYNAGWLGERLQLRHSIPAHWVSLHCCHDQMPFALWDFAFCLWAPYKNAD